MHTHSRSRGLKLGRPKLWSAAGSLLLFAGCRHRVQSYSILGSYFPAWLLCFAAGILLASLMYILLQRLRLAEQLAPPLLVYPALALLLTLSLWLMLYS